VKITGVNQKTVYFKNPKCGHLLEFNYSTPFTCQDPKCTEKPAEIDRLISEFGQAARVKYFAEGTIT
jgi:hypothetical protein